MSTFPHFQQALGQSIAHPVGFPEEGTRDMREPELEF